MVTQAHEQHVPHDNATSTRLDSLHDGIGHRPISPPDEPRELTRGSPWALAPWPTLEVAKAVEDLVDRYVPGRGNRELIAAAGRDPRARLEAVMRECVLPALEDVRDMLLEEGYDADLSQEAMCVAVRTRGFNGRMVAYAVEGGICKQPVFSLAGTQPGHELPRSPLIYIARGGARRKARLHHCSRAAMRRDALHHLRNQMLY